MRRPWSLADALLVLLWPHPQGLRPVDLWRALSPRPSYALVHYNLRRLCRDKSVQRRGRGCYTLSREFRLIHKAVEREHATLLRQSKPALAGVAP